MTYNLPLWAFEGYVFSIWTLLLDGLDHNKVLYKVKARIQPPLHYPRIKNLEEKDGQTQLLCYVSLIRACNKIL